MATAERTARQEWRAHWGLVFCATLGMSLLALPPVALGLFMEPLSREFGWSRASISAGMMVFAVVSTPLVPFAGALADRFGSRRVLIPGLVLTGAAFAAFGLLTPSLWHWFAMWVVFTLAQLLNRSPIWNRTVSAAFNTSRGLALAVLMAGIALGQLLTPTIASALIRDYGWRSAYGLLALGWYGLTLIATVLLFREPRAAAATAGAADTSPAPASSGGMTLKEALRDPRMLRIGFAILTQSTLYTGFTLHLFPLLKGLGMTDKDSAFITGLIGIATLAGQLLTGWLADRVRGSLLPVSSFLLPGVGYLLILQGSSTWALLTLGVLIAGYGSGAAINITTYLTTRYAGVRHFGKIFGLISSLMGLGAGLGPLIGGRIYDYAGTYTPYLLLGTGVALIAALAVLRLGAYPEFKPEPAGRTELS
ncbi:MAG: MFS transporter [Novosphingobium sp.]|jgi:MFS family permease|nr:MFS transporter [Novosphingobium sp.]